MDVTLQRAFRVMRLDRAVYREVAEDRRATLQALVILSFVPVCAYLAGVARRGGPFPEPLKLLGVIAAALLAMALKIGLFSAIAVRVGRLFGGSGAALAMFRAQGFSTSPLLILCFLIFLPVPKLLMMPFVFWSLCTSCLAAAEVLKVTPVKALRILLLSSLLILVAFLLLRLFIAFVLSQVA